MRIPERDRRTEKVQRSERANCEKGGDGRTQVGRRNEDKSGNNNTRQSKRDSCVHDEAKELDAREEVGRKGTTEEHT